MKTATSFWKKAEIPYTAVSAKGEQESKVEIMGVDDLIYIKTQCNGKLYEKLVQFKPLKTKTADENLELWFGRWCDKIQSWMKTRMNGLDFYNHDIKTNRNLGGYFEMALEGCYDDLYDYEY